MNSQRMLDHGVMPIHLGAIVVCCLILAGGWFFGYAPLMNQNQQATTIVDQAEQAEADAAQVKKQLDQLSEQLLIVQAELDQQPVSLQSASQINPLLAQLATWSETHALSITRTSAGRPVALAYYDYLPIQISGEGGFADLLAFFKRMMDERGDLGMVSFQVNRQASGGGVRFELELAWYVHSGEAPKQDDKPEQATAQVPTF